MTRVNATSAGASPAARGSDSDSRRRDELPNLESFVQHLTCVPPPVLQVQVEDQLVCARTCHGGDVVENLRGCARKADPIVVERSLGERDVPHHDHFHLGRVPPCRGRGLADQVPRRAKLLSTGGARGREKRHPTVGTSGNPFQHTRIGTSGGADIDIAGQDDRNRRSGFGRT